MAARVSVRTQLTLWSALMVAVALAIFGAALRVGVERIMVGGIDGRLRDRAERFQGPRPRGPGHRRQPGHMGQPGGRGQPFQMGQAFPTNLPGQQPFPPNDAPGQGPNWQNPPSEEGQPFPPGANNFAGAGPRPNGPNGPNGPRDPFPVRLIEGDTGAALEPGGAPGPWSRVGFEQAVRTGRENYSETQNDGMHLRVFSRPVVNPAGRRDVVQTAEPLDTVDAAIAGVTRALMLLIPAAVLLTALGGALLADRALRPVGRLATAAMQLGEAGDPSARLPGDHDGDEFGRLTAVLNGMLGRLEAAFERQRRFAADASHELRTPLATIKAHTSLALDDDTLTLDEARNALASVDRAADRAERLVRDLLLLVRAGTLPVRPETVVLRDVLAEAVKASQASVGGKHASLTVDAPETLVIVTDHDHLLRLVGNLIDNALRHTPPDGSVRIAARAQAGGTVALIVTDTGEGIAPEHLRRLGEPFYRPDAARSRRSGGAGLGLAICKGIAASLGGSLALDSRVGHGTTASVVLPVTSVKTSS